MDFMGTTLAEPAAGQPERPPVGAPGVLPLPDSSGFAGALRPGRMTVRMAPCGIPGRRARVACAAIPQSPAEPVNGTDR